MDDKAGWNWSWIVDAQQDDGKSFVVRSDEILTALAPVKRVRLVIDDTVANSVRRCDTVGKGNEKL